MKSKRLTLDIISIFASILVSSVFLLPIWHFTSTTTINEETSTLVTRKVRLFDIDAMNDVIATYKTYNHSLNLLFSYIFELMCIITMILILLFLTLTTITMIKRYSNSLKIFKVSKITSICIVISSLIALISALIFTSLSSTTITSSDILSYSLSLNITSGIYIFTVFTIFAGVIGYIANNVKENNELE